MGGGLCLALEKIRKANGELFDSLTKTVEMRSRPTQRAPDWWESPRFQAVSLAQGWFRQNSVVSSHPPAGNAHRYTANIKETL